MPPIAKINKLAPAVKAELIQKIFETPGGYEEITLWLNETHNLNISKTSVFEFAKSVRMKHSGLIEARIPLKTIADEAKNLETLGALLIQRELLNQRIDTMKAGILGVMQLPDKDQ